MGEVRPLGRDFDDQAGIEAHGDEMQRAKQLANTFYLRGMETFDDFIIGEQQAKEMYLALLATGPANGTGGVLLGDPGGAKSLLLFNGHKIVGGIEDNEVAVVPHKSDLSAAELVGKTSEMKRSGHRADGDFEETFSAEILPILRPGIKVVKFDEINRTSQVAINAALGILQAGKIEVANKDRSSELKATELDFVIASMNNYDTRYTYDADPALSGRMAMGAFMAKREPGRVGEAGKAMWADPDKEYDFEPEVPVVIHVNELHLVRRAIKHVFMPRLERDLGAELTGKMLDALLENGVRQADGRVSAQLIRTSKALSLLRAQKEVTDREIRDAVSYAMTSRLGMGTHKPQQEIDAIIAEVIK